MEDYSAWERSITEAGIPYYINHETEKTFWNHPLTLKMERELFSLRKIKYAAYRTALKLRIIQKATRGCKLRLSTVKEFFESNGMDESFNLKAELTASELMKLLKELFLLEVKSDQNVSMDPTLASELMLNWLLNVHDSSRKGVMRLLSVKISLTIICSGSPRQKYHYLFSQLRNQQGFVDEERIGFFIQVCLKIPKYLKEQLSFGPASIQPAVKNFLKQATNGNEGLCDDFVEWMLAEPQPLVWIPTLYRLAASETAKHECKCNICKLFPLVGFRYKCLQCFNYDICQECFWTGRTSKNHKLEHPTQEYCLPSSQASDLKDVKKMFKNKFFKRKKSKKKESSKNRFTEIPADKQSVGPKDYEGIEANEDEIFAEEAPSFDASEYSENISSTMQENKAIHELIDSNTWEPESQPLQRPQSIESLPLESSNEEPPDLNYAEVADIRPQLKIPPVSTDQRDEIDRIIASIEEDNRELQSQIEGVRDSQQQEVPRQTMLMSENARLRFEQKRAEERQGILEEHNRILEMEMQKMRLLLQQTQTTVSLPNVRDTKKKTESDSKYGEAAISNGNVMPHIRSKSEHFLTLSSSFPYSDSKLRIPTSLVVGDSKITPIYEEIPEAPPPRRYITKPVCSRTAQERVRNFRTSRPDRDAYKYNEEPFYEEIREVWRGKGRTPTRQSGPLRLGSISYEEHKLDQTVKWAMDNFDFSETESNC